MATLTEKHEMTKEVLGSLESIRKFVESESIHTEDLESIVTRINTVKEELKLAKQKEQQQKLEDVLSTFLGSGLSKEQLEAALNKVTGKAVAAPKKKEGSSTPTLKYAFTYPNAAGETITVTRGVKGPRTIDQQAYMDNEERGYKSLVEWVEKEKLEPVEQK